MPSSWNMSPPQASGRSTWWLWQSKRRLTLCSRKR
jgi:hypothetical protein